MFQNYKKHACSICKITTPVDAQSWPLFFPFLIPFLLVVRVAIYYVLLNITRLSWVHLKCFMRNYSEILFPHNNKTVL